MTTARRAVATHRPDLAAPPPPPDGPGPFGFSDSDRVRMILSGAGWAQIQLQPFTVDCAFPVEHLPLFVRRLAPAGVDLETVSPTDRDALLHRIEEAYTPFVKDGHVTFTAACWSICARTRKAKAAC